MIPKAAYVSIHLARFHSLRTSEPIEAERGEGVLFCGTAADTRADCTDGRVRKSFVDSRNALSPWLSDAVESWAAVLQPFRHLGEANYLNAAEAGSLFDSMGPMPEPDAPIGLWPPYKPLTPVNLLSESGTMRPNSSNILTPDSWRAALNCS